jgi:hypothetical protein
MSTKVRASSGSGRLGSVSGARKLHPGAHRPHGRLVAAADRYQLAEPGRSAHRVGDRRALRQRPEHPLGDRRARLT